MQHDPTPTASAGLRVSDEELAAHVRNALRKGYRLPQTDRLALDLADSRTDLAAANARIAVLEQLAQAVRDANELLMDRYYEVPHDQWDRISDMAWNIATATQDGPGAAHE